MNQNPCVYVAFFERYRPWLYVCNMPFHMNETSEQHRQPYFEEVKSIHKQISGRKSERGDQLQRMHCIFTHIVLFYINTISHLGQEYLVFKAIILKKLSPFLKNGHSRKIRGKNSMKGRISSFHAYSFLARIVLPFFERNTV